jgi:hypothetical protein
MNHNGHHDGASISDLQLTPVRFEYTHPTAGSVSVAGTFNDWDPTAQYMDSSADGLWMVETSMAPGTYEYRLVVDGTWMPDPLAKTDITNPFGGKNSVVVVAKPSDSIPEPEPAELSLPALLPTGKRKAKKEIVTKAIKTTAGVWIDHRKAVLAIESRDGEKLLEILSKVEKQPRRVSETGSSKRYRDGVPSDPHGENEFAGHLNEFYDEVIATIRHAEFILLFGPGEAKGELKKRLDDARLSSRIVSMESSDKMTDRQIAAKVRYYVQR